jgi:DNA-binding MarR family transcriptional regulator
MTSTTTPARVPDTGGRGPVDAAAADAIIAALRSAYRELKCIGSRRMLHKGMSMTQQYVLAMLDRHGEMTMSQLAEMLDVSLSNATGLVDRMEERSLIERARVPDDRRIVLVRITDPGRAALSEVEVLREDLLARILSELDAAQLERISLVMADIRGALSRVAAADPSFLDHRHRPTA